LNITQKHNKYNAKVNITQKNNKNP